MPSFATRARDRLIQVLVLSALLVVAWMGARQFYLGMQVKHRQEHRRTQAFEQWVAWRSQHCRYEGSLSLGVFVCDNGLRFQGFSDRYGEIRVYPAFILKDPGKNDFVVTEPSSAPAPRR